MSFLQSAMLFALPLAALPIIIHLIHLHRRRTVPWAAMMFLRAAQQMNRGFSRLRRWLILAFRVLAVLALLLMAARPLAGGWLGLTGGVPDTVIVLLDRSASMEQQNLATGLSKRESGLKKLADGVKEAYGGRTRLILIDSATGAPQEIERVDALSDLPVSWATDTTADIPALLQNALDYITNNQTGRTDIWLLSDLRQPDWDAGGGRWEPMRQAFGELQGVRFHLLSYAQPAEGNLTVLVDRVVRRETSDRAELLLDLQVSRNVLDPQPMELPIRFVINGVASTFKTELRDNTLALQAHTIPIDKSVKRGWGRVELPADSVIADNAWHFVFDELPALRSAIVTDDPLSMSSVKAALDAPLDSSRKYAATVLTSDRVAEIEWDLTALVVWHVPLPPADSIEAKQLQTHVDSGRALIFLPPETADDNALFGLRWGEWKTPEAKETEQIGWWRNDTGLLENARDGSALPVGELEFVRRREIVSEGGSVVPLARMDSNEPILVRATPESAALEGGAYFLGALPGTNSSSLARDGVVFFAMMHRALNAGAGSLGTAQQRSAAFGVLGDAEAASQWEPVGRPEDEDAESKATKMLPLRAGVLEKGERLVALNRPLREDNPDTLGLPVLGELFEGLDHRIVEDTLEDGGGLASEIWRTFLILMALALVLEALLSMPPRKPPVSAEQTTSFPGVGDESSTSKEAA